MIAVEVDKNNDDTKPLSEPLLQRRTAADAPDTQIEKFMRFVKRLHPEVPFDDANCAANSQEARKAYTQLHQWSVQCKEAFWEAVWQFTDIIHSTPYSAVMQPNARATQASGMCAHPPHWFVGARLNFAQNVLRFRDDKPAIWWRDERSKTHSMTFAQLYAQVAAVATFLREACGVDELTCVAAYAPNSPHAVIFALAAASIGATFTACSCDFGVAGVVERFAQSRPSVLLSCDAVLYNGKRHENAAKLQAIFKALEGVCHTLVVFAALTPIDATNVEADALEQAVVADCHFDCKVFGWRHVLQKYATTQEIPFVQLPFEHPLFVMYSSGTTGRPKCLVHGAGGTLLQHRKEHAFHVNITRKDIFLQYTTIGWMMWQWMLTALAAGAGIFLVDGSPLRPDPLALWRAIDEVGVTVFGTSAKYLLTLQESRITPIAHVPLRELRLVLSTGSPLPAATFRWVYDACVPSDRRHQVGVGSISGGTDILSLFAGCHPLLPVYAGQLQCVCLGMDVVAWDAVCNEPCAAGVAGELVCRTPFPCMPVCFLNDKVADDERPAYSSAYFNALPGMWHHGDWMCVSPDTLGIHMLGRSDGVLNPSGVRFGSAELYAVVAEHFSDVVEDALAIGQQIASGDERVLLFVCMRQPHRFDAALETAIRNAIRTSLSPRHVPAIVCACPAIPYTLNGKKVEIAVKKIVNSVTASTAGSADDCLIKKEAPIVANEASLLNPECLAWFRTFASENLLLSCGE